MAARIFSLVALAAVARAHVIMSLPVPFDVANLNNSPLDASGSDFPCKNPKYDSIGTMNKYTIGGKGQLQFVGTAVHGGGSCQVSVTYDNPPTKDSTWKVIKSYEGGCPARNAVGNLDGNSASLPNPNTYDFEMPAIPSGEAILAWTWFNKIGNREMYMNCAPITISGTGTAEYYKSLPDMFKANIASETECTTLADTDLEFPDPGNVVDYDNGSTTAFATPGTCSSTSNTHPKPSTAPASTTAAAPKTTKAAKTTKSTPAETPTETAPAETPAETSAPAGTSAGTLPSASIPGGVFLPNPSSTAAAEAPADTTTAAAEAPAETTTAAAEAPAETTAAATPSTAPATGNTETDTNKSTSGTAMSGTCTTEGLFNCIGGTQFQRCASGSWTPAQDLAAGTKCTAGTSTDLTVSAA